MKTSNRLLAAGVTLMAVMQSADLAGTWSRLSTERTGILLFLTWILFSRLLPRRQGGLKPVKSLGVLLMVMSGQATGLNAVDHLALILSFGLWMEPSRARGIWYAAALLWCPACGWLLSDTAPMNGLALRLALMLAALWHVGRINGYRFSVHRKATRLGFISLTLFPWLLPQVEVHADTLTYSPVQSPARPFGLGIVDQVALAGSDPQSAAFQSETLPMMQQLVNENLNERTAVNGNPSSDGLIALDTTKLQTVVPTDVRAYFVGEGAGYHNSLGFNTQVADVNDENSLLIFPDASSPRSYLSSGGATRTNSEPLMPGDFVEMGNFEAGTAFDFFLISNGVNGGQNVYWTDKEYNSDGLDHVVAFAKVASPYLLIGFEDQPGGGDLDYNGLVFAVYFGEENVQSLIETASIEGVPAPEPLGIGLLAIGAGGWLLRRKRKTGRAQRATGSSPSLDRP